ncbi:hypothetical protein BASA81_010259 [Batrachochytrium salamandrivorans]|nr:hypothetical protein BASA81_010259 [Batrachochytrium salamandrivorans]
MIHIKILRGLDLGASESELYLTLTLAGLSKTSKVAKKNLPIASQALATEGERELESQRSVRSALALSEGWVWDEELDLVYQKGGTGASGAAGVTGKEGEDEIEVECFNASEKFKAQGKVNIPISRLAVGQPVQQWYSLQDGKGSILLNLTLVAPVAPSTPTSSTPSSTNNTSEATAPPTSTSKSEVNCMPMGLADYFVIAGCARETSRQERLGMLSRRRRNHAPKEETGVDELSQATVSGVDCVTLSPLLLERYPVEDRPEIEFPTKCEMFLLPDGVEILANPKQVPSDRNFTFILVNNNVKLFGFCLEVWEPLPGADELDLDLLYAPTVYCYLTRLPLSHWEFRWILAQTVRARSTGFFPRVVNRVLLEIPTPLPGLFSVEFDLLGRRQIALPDFVSSLPPLLYPDLCSHLLGWFSVEDVVRLWIAALTEQKILLHSTNRETLGMLSESLVQLMYPFKWENGFIPVLPTSLMQIFDAPIPVILGLHTKALKLIPESAQIDEVFIQVDADRCTIQFPEDTGDRLPVELKVRLFRMIRQAQLKERDAGKRDKLIRFAFVECLASLLQGYRECFFSLSSGADGGTVFNKAQFFLHQTAQRAQLSSTLGQLFAASTQPVALPRFNEDNAFLNHFFETTAFERFKVSQHDPENELFHQVYRTRRARERERDQRLGSLAGLQNEAAPPLVRAWGARLARWDPKSQEPILPSGATTAGEGDGEGMITLRCVPLIAVGERVRCGVFGEGIVLTPPDENDVCQVKLAIPNAIGYLHLSCLHAVVGVTENRLDTDYRAQFAPLVAQSCSKPVFKKAFAHYKRMVGAVATESVVRKTVNTKTPLENKIERIVIRTITNIFQDKAVSEADIRDCHTHLTEPFARNTLMQVLKSQHSDSTWLATPGRGRRLGEQAFASLYELVDSLLVACAQREDFSNGRTVLDVSPFFYCGEETLQTKLKGHMLWSKLMFWEYAFAETLVAINAVTSPSNTSLLAGPNNSLVQDDPPAPQQAKSLTQLQDQALLYAPNLPLFEQLSVFVHNMLNLDVPEDMARAFVDRVAVVFTLDQDHRHTLNMLITNICKSMSSYEEEQEIDASDSASVLSPPSPSNLQRRGSSHAATNTRKRTGIDGMISRFAVSWRKATTATATTPAPAGQTKARRDSVGSWLG